MRHKRELLFGAALAGIAATAANAAPPSDRAIAAAAQWADRGDSFTVPQGRVILTRELRKELADGKQFVSRRRYAIRFVPADDGYRVEGELVGSEVEAPAELDALAALERTRSEPGLFPIRLDRQGMIAAQGGKADPHTEAQVIAAGAAYLGGRPLSDAERSAALAMAASLQAQARSAGTSWPADLFRPARRESTEIRELPLPGGGSGEVTIRIIASEAPSGLMDRFQRRVVTNLGGSSRATIETWTLASAR